MINPLSAIKRLREALGRVRFFFIVEPKHNTKRHWLYCTGCGRANPAEARFCSHCGTALGYGTERSAETTSLLRSRCLRSSSAITSRVKSVRPDIQVLFMSGYTDQAVVNHGILESDAVLLQKPFTLNALALKLREILGCESLK